MHGGADGSGAPLGNKNALKHGRFTRNSIEERKTNRALRKIAKKFLKDHNLPKYR
jgi:glucans biosynthesis protein